MGLLTSCAHTPTRLAGSADGWFGSITLCNTFLQTRDRPSLRNVTVCRRRRRIDAGWLPLWVVQVNTVSMGM